MPEQMHAELYSSAFAAGLFEQSPALLQTLSRQLLHLPFVKCTSLILHNQAVDDEDEPQC